MDFFGFSNEISLIQKPSLKLTRLLKFLVTDCSESLLFLEHKYRILAKSNAQVRLLGKFPSVLTKNLGRVKQVENPSVFFDSLQIETANLQPKEKEYLIEIPDSKGVCAYLLYRTSKKVDTNLFTWITAELNHILNQFKIEQKLEAKIKEKRNLEVEVEMMLNFSEIFNSETNIQEIHETLLAHIAFSLDASKGFVLVKNQNSNLLEIAACLNFDGSLFENRIITDSIAIFMKAKQEKKSFIEFEKSSFGIPFEFTSNYLFGPLMNEGKVTGCIVIIDKETRTCFGNFIAKDLRLFESFIKKINLSYQNLILVDSLKSAQKTTKSIMSSITSGIIKTNLFGEIEYINEAVKNIFSFETDVDILWNHYSIVLVNNPLLCELLEFAESKSHLLYEEDLTIINTHGSRIQVNLTVSPVFEDGEFSGLVLSIEDLTDINKVKSTFKQYVSGNIVEKLLQDDTQKLGGEEQEVCILFCDIRGFTAMSEKMEPSQVVYLLNHYFERMIEVLFSHNGTLDKIIGDELMVLFGVPEKTENDILNAIRTAIDMFTVLEVFNAEMSEQNLPELKIGIGINSGKVITGNIGSKQQMNYTVIGDNVNLAARLCSAASAGEVIISESVYNECKDLFEFQQNKDLKVKGKSGSIKNWIFDFNTLYG